jgi:malonate decarboxylase epsilon subunit
VSIALLFPGQGAQSPGFLHRLPEHPQVRATLDQASEILGEDILALDSAEALSSTVAVQLTTLVAGVAVWRCLVEEGVNAAAVAGLSVGAFAAAVACDALSFVDALPLVKLRAQGMERAYPQGYGMAAIIGLDERRVAALVERAGGADKQLYLANVNAPAQMVLAGPDAALDAAIAAARQAGARKAKRLAVSVPSHCPLLEGVSRQLAQAMTKIELKTPRIPYVGNCRARVTRDTAGVAEDLINNVAHTVRWYDATAVLYELGARLFIEPPPGQVLSRLAREAFGDARSAALDDVDLDSVVLLARREQSRAA